MRKILFLNQILAVVSLLCYLSVWVSPGFLWITGFGAMSIPLMLLLNLLFAVYWLLRRKYKYLLYPLLTLLIGYPFIFASIAMNSPSTDEKQFTVLNYNVRVFNAYRHLNKRYIASKAIVKWAREDNSDIKCFQEFYNMDKSRTFNTIRQLTEQGKYEVYMKRATSDEEGGQFGLAIFSRFPIIAKGEINLKDKSYNDAIFADVLMGSDTIRIYNVHLQSMHIGESHSGLIATVSDVAQRLKRGFIARARQVDQIAAHIGACPYPVILCGDLNDLPYSYTYFKLRQQLSNSFEKAGQGLGFTYNGKLFFLRIDNQFFSHHIEAHQHRVHREVEFSDHFPLKTAYSLRRNP